MCLTKSWLTVQVLGSVIVDEFLCWVSPSVSTRSWRFFHMYERLPMFFIWSTVYSECMILGSQGTDSFDQSKCVTGFKTSRTIVLICCYQSYPLSEFDHKLFSILLSPWCVLKVHTTLVKCFKDTTNFS